MKTGTFTYLTHDGRRAYLRVRECPNPMKVREFLEGLLDRPVRWQESR